MVVIQAIWRLCPVVSTVLVFRTIRPGTRTYRIYYGDECTRYRALGQDVSPEFMVEEVSARIFSRCRVVVFFIRSSVFSIRVTQGRGRLRFVFQAVSRAGVFRRVRGLIINRIVRPVNGRECFRQDVRFFFTFRPYLRVLTKLSRPAQCVSGYRRILLRILIPIRAIR